MGLASWLKTLNVCTHFTHLLKVIFNGHLFVHFCSFKKHSKETSTYAEFELESSK